MAQEICGKTKVTVNGKEFLCETFTRIWEVLNENGYSIDEENKGYLLRCLFINGKVYVDENLGLEIVWEE